MADDLVAVRDTADDPWWQAVVVCPACHSALKVNYCGTCDRQYANDGGTPVLKDAAMARVVSWSHSAARSFTSEAELLKTFGHAPPGPDAAIALPHHLDPAHAAVMLTLPRGARILEIGCGGGQTRSWYQERGFNYVGTDVSKTRVFAWLQEFGGPDVLCDAHFLPFAEASFDVVYCAAVFEHLACPVLAVQEVRRVLKPGGLFLGNVSFLEPWHDHSYFHMSPLGAAELMFAGGLEVRSLWPGRGYSGFRAIAQMTLRPGLRWLGDVGHVVHAGQQQVLALARRLTGKAVVPPVLAEGTIAGAIDWIAVKPS